LEPLQDLKLEEATPTIYFHALASINTQTLNIEGYLKKKKVTILFDSSSNHYLINYKLVKLLNCFIYPTPKFQVMITDAGTINCLGKCHSIKVTMGEYSLDNTMIAIEMDGVDVVLWVQWL
jgi:hypothetical protein